jgi:hypothetical protein
MPTKHAGVLSFRLASESNALVTPNAPTIPQDEAYSPGHSASRAFLFLGHARYQLLDQASLSQGGSIETFGIDDANQAYV